MNSNRIPYIDLGAGIMILWVIILHAISVSLGMEWWGIDRSAITDLSQLPIGIHYYINPSGEIAPIPVMVWFPYLHFVMPWFFYKSGQFFVKRNQLDLVRKDSHKLLRQFIIWSAVGYVIFLVFCWMDGTLSWREATYRVMKRLFLEGHVNINIPLWFLFTIIGVRQIANIVLPQKDSKYFWLICFLVILFGYIVSYAAYRWNHRLLPYWVANGAAGLAFFTMGYSLQKDETKWWLLIPCLLIYLACCIFGFTIVGMRGNTLTQGVYLLDMPTCLAGIVVFNVLCRLIAKHLRHFSLPLEIVGQFAMIIYVTHGIIYRSIAHLISFYELVSLMPYVFWIIVGAYILFLPLFCYLSTKIHH